MIGHTALTWTYLVLLTNFFIAHRWMAVGINAVLIIGMQLIPGFFHDVVHAASVFVSASLITGFSLIFAARTQDDRDQLERAFRRLSVDHRAVVVLHHYLDLPLPRVADALGIPEGTARSRLYYAMRGLRAALDADARPASREVAP